MGYDKNGLGFAEMAQTWLYMPEIALRATEMLEDGLDPRTVQIMLQKAIDAYNKGFIEASCVA